LSTAKITTAPGEGTALDKFFAGGRVLCDGAMGTMLFEQSDFTGCCCEELNLSQPERVASVHAEYLRAGARIIETNTFGGNGFRLHQHGLRHKLREINLAAVRIARQSVEHIAKSAYVAGTVGPLGVRLDPHGPVSLREAEAAFAEQMSALTEAAPGIGVDLLIIETMTSLGEAVTAIRAARDVAPHLRLVVMMTVDQFGNCLDGTSPEMAASRLTELGADAIGCNCSHGPTSVLSAIERMRTVTDLPLAAMPNAGLPIAVKSRNVYKVSPKDMAACMHKLLNAGANLIGGCCGTTPEHIKAMGVVLQDFEAHITSTNKKATGL
jgi:homocysteine S-methyltransferase